MNKIKKTEKEWRLLLDHETFQVTRKSGTERPFSGKYLNEKSNGTYHCSCCKNELFSSNSKFDSGTGWPSFYEPISKNNVNEISDSSYDMNRIEILCSQCDAHLGHLFDDGPEPTGLRYCMNSLSLKFKKK